MIHTMSLAAVPLAASELARQVASVFNSDVFVYEMCACYVYNRAKDHYLWSVNNARHCSFLVSKNSLKKNNFVITFTGMQDLRSVRHVYMWTYVLSCFAREFLHWSLVTCIQCLRRKCFISVLPEHFLFSQRRVLQVLNSTADITYEYIKICKMIKVHKSSNAKLYTLPLF